MSRADAGFCLDLGLCPRIPGLIRQVACHTFCCREVLQEKKAQPDQMRLNGTCRWERLLTHLDFEHRNGNKNAGIAVQLD